jgi:hypothetical protein
MQNLLWSRTHTRHKKPSMKQDFLIETWDRLIISTPWRFLFYAFFEPARRTRLGRYYNTLGNFYYWPCRLENRPALLFRKKWARLLLLKRVASSTVRFKLGRFFSFKKVMYASVWKYVTGKRPYTVTEATQPEHNRISSYPVQKHESNPTLNDNEAYCLAIVMTLPNADSHIYMLLLFILVPGQGTVCVPLEHGYEAWKKKEKVQNNNQTDSDHQDKSCIDDRWLPWGQQHHRQLTTVTMTTGTRDTTNVSLVIYHLRDVVLTMSKSVVATMIPMMGGHEENNNQGKAHRDHDISNTSD